MVEAGACDSNTVTPSVTENSAKTAKTNVTSRTNAPLNSSSEDPRNKAISRIKSMLEKIKNRIQYVSELQRYSIAMHVSSLSLSPPY